MRRRALLLGLGLATAGATALAAGPEPDSNGRVVLLHGLGRSPRSMASLGETLEGSGFRVVNIGYASMKHPIRELVESLHAELRACCLDADHRLDFVTHSLGGILVRAYVDAHPPGNLGRVVMLSPPNRGSELADRVRETWLAQLNPVPVVEELGTNPESIPNRLGPPPFEVGVITGDRSWHPGAWLIEGKDDGVVSVESARLEGRDFLVVDADHTFIMRNPEVARQVVRFLRTGAFARGADAER